MENTKILTLEKELSKVVSLVSELRASSEEKKTDNDIDFSRLTRYSNQVAFTEHYIKKLDTDLAASYCILLLAAIDLLSNREKKVKQYYFIARISEAANLTKSFEELVTEAKMVSADDYVKLKNELSEEGRMAFLFDFLLMISLSGDIDNAQLNYYCEALSFFGIDDKQLQGIFETVKCVLSGEEGSVYDYINAFPVQVIAGYIPKPVRRTVITDGKGLKSCKDKAVIVYGVSFKDESILIDDYKKADIRFSDCNFSGVGTMTAKKTKTRFERCVFSECSRDNSESFDGDRDIKEIEKDSVLSVFDFENASFVDCVFSNCQADNIDFATIFLQIRNGLIRNCIFKKCSIGAGGVGEVDGGATGHEYGAVLYTKRTIIENCHFIDCMACDNGVWGGKKAGYSVMSSRYQYVHMILCKDGTVKNCEFLRCRCKGDLDTYTEQYHYLINTINSTQQQNTFTQCRTASEPVGTAEWGIKIS